MVIMFTSIVQKVTKHKLFHMSKNLVTTKLLLFYPKIPNKTVGIISIIEQSRFMCI